VQPVIEPTGSQLSGLLPRTGEVVNVVVAPPGAPMPPAMAAMLPMIAVPTAVIHPESL
jgi:hypothetical protein